MDSGRSTCVDLRCRVADPVLLLLDVDGVINAFGKPGWGAAPRKTKIGECTIRWAPRLVFSLKSLQRAGLIEMWWSTTWCGDELALKLLEARLGLQLPRAFTERPPHKTWGDMKAGAALDALNAGRRVAWADDTEVRGAWYLFPRFESEERQGSILPLIPHPNRGLQPDHVQAIEGFARASHRTGMQD
jgi:hypothetical protein